MIAFVRGAVAAIGPEQAVVDVGGVGFAVQCTPATLATLRLGQQAQLPTALVVREDSLTLFGFADEEERVVFDLAQTVSGVGPRLAQALLATLSPDELRQAVAAEDLATLVRVPGIGRKGAQRLVLELKDRLGAPAPAAAAGRSAAPPAAGREWSAAVHSALTGLGWSTREADEAVAALRPVVDSGETASDLPTLLRLALRSMDRS
ncbi:MAG: Holliday junction branch migration protein RuvA [Actinomycetota bacterium]|nr:MAG: Holliday junction branch migration protein RuvA [Actinomycetota bacterium]